MTTTTTEAKSTKKIKITMSERRPLTIVEADWPAIASASAHDGKVKSQANNEWEIRVREHRDGRRIVYGWHEAGNGGQYITFRPSYGGFLIEPETRANGQMRDPGDGGPLVSSWPNEAETVRAIRRVAGIIGRDDLGDECIGDLPSEEIS